MEKYYGPLLGFDDISYNNLKLLASRIPSISSTCACFLHTQVSSEA